MEISASDITEFVYCLKQEQLYIESERKHLKHLNKKILESIEKVYHASFVKGEQRRNYNDFLVIKPHSSPPACCQRANILSQLQFVDGYRVLEHNEPFFGALLSGIRDNPQLVAECLVVGESIGQDLMQAVASILFSSVYSNCLLAADEDYVLCLLKNLMKSQIAASDNPCSLLHKGSCAFSQVFKAYIDSLPQAQVFLTAALHQPIMELLMEDELFLEIDPLKAAERFPPEERQKRFGEEGTPEYEKALARYRSWTIKKLVKITCRFIENIKEAMHGFPSALSWLVRTLYELLIDGKKVDNKIASTICIDLIFDLFICSAVVTPEPQGIIEAPVSHISRFNLMQVAQILQVLARNQWESPDAKLNDLYSNFDAEILSGFVERIIEEPFNEYPPARMTNKLPWQGLTKSSCLIPQQHLNTLIKFLFKVLHKMSDKSDSYSQLEVLLKPIEPLLQELQAKTTGAQSTSSNLQSVTPTGSPRKNLLSKVKNSRKSTKQSDDSDALEDSLTSSTSLSNNSGVSANSEEEEVKPDLRSCDYEVVLVVSLNEGFSSECPGLLSEEKVLSAIQSAKCTSKVRLNIEGDEVPVGSGSEGTIEKRTRFSLSHDEGSIGNTSDNLEAISEAASNHSVTSSLDDVEQADQPDNLSDMVSANVSGRGTPNVSGRDTPSSFVTDGDEANRTNEVPNRPRNPVSRAKNASADMEEKFGRFEINPIINGDETTSLVSDTWSTDVLASDSETIEAAEDNEQLLDQHLQELDRMHGGSSSQFRRGESAGETFDTTSEAWSTDVLASDSERMTEFDTDDTQSVARSDDTGRSEAEVEVAANSQLRPNQEPEDNVTPRVPSSRSPVEGVRLGRDIAEGESAEGAMASPGGILKDPRKIVPVMQVSTSENIDRSVSFRPINPEKDDNSSIKPSVLRPQVDATRNQTLGRLSLNLSELSNNGIVPVNQPLLLNPCVTGTQNKSLKPEEPSKKSPGKSKKKSADGQRKVLSANGSAEESSINLSTASLASSSSSSGSDLPGKTKKNQSNNEMQHAPLQACISAPVSSLAATGAIPKSISFDKTAEKGDKDLDNDGKTKKGFFKGFKLPGFKGKRKSLQGSFNRSSDDYSVNRNSAADMGMRKSLSEDSRAPIYEESSDDILDKYRKKPDNTDADNESHNESSINAVSLKADDESSVDLTNMEQGSYAFNDAKRKLRIVLNCTDFWLYSTFRVAAPVDSNHHTYDVISWLKLQLAEAQSVHDRSLVAQLRECLRCVQLFDEDTQALLVQKLSEDYQRRASYVSYLVRCKQGLLNSIAHMEKLFSRITCDTDVISSSLVSVCVRLFLEKKEHELATFIQEFTQLTVPDEKVEMIETFLGQHYAELERNPMWLSCTGAQLEFAQMTLEREVMSHIYIHALYPNGDGDVSRDQVLHEHIDKLSNIITANHKDLRISKMYQYECPWPSAQAELRCLSAYKTAGDKVRCVVRTSQVIMHLLSMSQDTSIPAADDFIPVLVYVLIKANPPSLLSTAQYVNLFYEQRLHGEDQYWWTQFCSAIEFIKTMDYGS